MELSNIPPIPDFSKYQTLIDELSTGACIFIGAGVSKLAGYPLWNELALHVIDGFFDSKLITVSRRDALKKAGPKPAIDNLLNQDKDLFIKIVKELFEICSCNEKPIYREFIDLVKMKGNVIIQTNYDQALQKAVGIPDSEIQIFPNLDNQPKKLNYIHGRIDQLENCIFATPQFTEAYLRSDSPIPLLLDYVFNNFTSIFLGYSFSDNDIDMLLRKNCGKKIKIHVAEYCDIDKHDIEIMVSNSKINYGMDTILYNRELDDYAVFIEVIKSLSKCVSSLSIQDSSLEDL